MRVVSIFVVCLGIVTGVFAQEPNTEIPEKHAYSIYLKITMPDDTLMFEEKIEPKSTLTKVTCLNYEEALKKFSTEKPETIDAKFLSNIGLEKTYYQPFLEVNNHAMEVKVRDVYLKNILKTAFEQKIFDQDFWDMWKAFSKEKQNFIISLVIHPNKTDIGELNDTATTAYGIIVDTIQLSELEEKFPETQRTYEAIAAEKFKIVLLDLLKTKIIPRCKELS